APGGLEQRCEDFDGRGFARPVRADVAEAIAFLDLQIEVGEGHECAVALGEIDGLDDGGHGRCSNVASGLFLVAAAVSGARAAAWAQLLHPRLPSWFPLRPESESAAWQRRCERGGR